VMRRYARRGRRAAATMLLLELVGLDFQLTETWTRR
jgi:hypothetical protein